MKGRCLLLLCLASVVLAGCSPRKGRVIPRGKMADIYCDMFVADQWLNDYGRAKKTADTTLFYEPIFRSHGYTSKDFDRSLTHYLSDPERFSKILKEVADRLDAESKRLAAIQEEIENFHGIGGYERIDFPTDTLSWPDSLVLWPIQDTIKTDMIDNELL